MLSMHGAWYFVRAVPCMVEYKEYHYSRKNMCVRCTRVREAADKQMQADSRSQIWCSLCPADNGED
jgi:hypothetical protein